MGANPPQNPTRVESDELGRGQKTGCAGPYGALLRRAVFAWDELGTGSDTCSLNCFYRGLQNSGGGTVTTGLMPKVGARCLPTR